MSTTLLFTIRQTLLKAWRRFDIAFFASKRKEVIELERITEDEFLFIWEPILGTATAWSEYEWYSFCCDLDEIDEIDFGEEDLGNAG